jgi:hypothetical protein
MRTTLSLDDDVAALLNRLRRARRAGLKELVNEALRRGLREMNTPSRPTAPYRTPSADLGQCLVGGIDDVAEVLAVVEGESLAR